MTGKSANAPKRAGKTEPGVTIPHDVGEFVGTVAHEVQSIARLARGLCEADASQESAALIKRRSRLLDEGVHGASKSLLDQPFGKILDKKNVHVAQEEAVSSVGNLATVIASRLNILHEFAAAVQKRNILGTPEGLQFLDKHRAAHYPRIVPLVEPTDGHSQLAEENAQLKQDIALVQKEADELAHDLGQRDADAEFDSSSSSGQSRRHRPKVGSGAFIERMTLILAGLIFGALFTGFGWWVAHLQTQRAAFEAGRAEQAIELRHLAEVNASESARNSEKEGRLRVEAEVLAANKIRMVDNLKGIVRKYIDRAKQARTEESVEDSIIALRIAGDMYKASRLNDEQLLQTYDMTADKLVLEFIAYLNPDTATPEVLDRLTLEAAHDSIGRSDQ